MLQLTDSIANTKIILGTKGNQFWTKGFLSPFSYLADAAMWAVSVHVYLIRVN